MLRRHFLAVLLAGFLLTACGGIPVPADKANYIGQWKGLGVSLVITADGGVDYKRVSGSGATSVTAALQGFDGDNFVVGISFFSTTFRVQKPPHQQDGQWKMVVEGIELTKLP